MEKKGRDGAKKRVLEVLRSLHLWNNCEKERVVDDDDAMIGLGGNKSRDMRSRHGDFGAIAVESLD